MLKGVISAEIVVVKGNTTSTLPYKAEFIVEDWGDISSKTMAEQEAYLEARGARELMQKFVGVTKQYSYRLDTKVFLTDYKVSYREVY